jgi:hypothetical protein
MTKTFRKNRFSIRQNGARHPNNWILILAQWSGVAQKWQSYEATAPKNKQLI